MLPIGTIAEIGLDWLTMSDFLILRVFFSILSVTDFLSDLVRTPTRSSPPFVSIATVP